MATETVIRRLAEAAATLCHPFLEVALYASGGEEVAVFNRFGVGEPPTEPRGPQVCQLDDGRKVKTLTHAVHDEAGNLTYLVQMRYDLSLFAELASRIETLFQGAEPAPQTAGGEVLIEGICTRYEREQSVLIAAMTRAQKRELVYRLQQGGAFDFKEGANLIAARLSISRATVYNYLKWAQSVQKVSIHQVDAFTTERFGGNPAGVVLDAQSLSDEMMGKIAREMNLSETAFVLPSRKADFALRYFTPSGDEVSFCGHSTVGALYMLAHEGRHGITESGSYSFQVETRAGVLTMRAELGADDEIGVAFDAPPIRLKPSSIDHETLCAALGIDIRDVDLSKPVMFEATNRDLYMTVLGLERLGELSIDQRSAERFARTEGVVTLCLLTPETFDPKNTVHARCFAPGVGVPEDPFTGSVQGGLAAYLIENDMIAPDTQRIGSEQGHFIKRPGSVEVEVKLSGKRIYATVYAKAVHLFSTEIQLT